ncbi:MAG: hypothetical protein MUO53_08245 [Maribacter sp.]|nr:hypothetical protein [Maribacter sp.]
MSRSHILFVLLSLWIFAIVAPPIITFLDKDLKSVVSINLNEEEPHEQGKKSVDQKLIIDQHTTNYSLLSKLQQPVLYAFDHIKKSNHALEIVLPPPKFLI